MFNKLSHFLTAKLYKANWSHFLATVASGLIVAISSGLVVFFASENYTDRRILEQQREARERESREKISRYIQEYNFRVSKFEGISFLDTTPGKQRWIIHFCSLPNEEILFSEHRGFGLKALLLNLRHFNPDLPLEPRINAIQKFEEVERELRFEGAIYLRSIPPDELQILNDKFETIIVPLNFDQASSNLEAQYP